MLKVPGIGPHVSKIINCKKLKKNYAGSAGIFIIILGKDQARPFLMKKVLFTIVLLAVIFPAVAQIPVSQEPRHHPVLVNAHVRLLDVHIPPGDTSLIHIHQTPSVFLILNNVKTGSEVIQEEDHSKSLYRHDGNIWFEGFYEVPRIHRVWNSDTAEFHVMDIELPNKNYMVIDSVIREPSKSFEFLFEEKPVRVYKLIMRPGREISLDARKADILMIQISDAVNPVTANEKSFLKKGAFLYIPAGNRILIKNNGSGLSAFAFLEIK